MGKDHRAVTVVSLVLNKPSPDFSHCLVARQCEKSGLRGPLKKIGDDLIGGQKQAVMSRPGRLTESAHPGLLASHTPSQKSLVHGSKSPLLPSGFRCLSHRRTIQTDVSCSVNRTLVVGE